MVYRALNLVTWYLPQCFLALCFQAVTCHICLHLLLIDSIFFPSTMRLVNAPFSKILIYLLGGLIAFASIESITHELEGHHEEHALSDCTTCHVATADDYLAACAETLSQPLFAQSLSANQPRGLPRIFGLSVNARAPPR